MKITVIGCGRWGSCIAWYLHSLGHKVSLYGRSSSENMKQLMSERRNEYIPIPDSLTLTTDLYDVKSSEIIVISVNSQGLRSLCGELKALDLDAKTFVLCMKGIENNTCKRLSEVMEEELPGNRVAVWLGPGHVEEFYRGIPNCMVIDSNDDDVKSQLIEAFSGGIIRFYYGTDFIGSEIGAAAKNVIGVAAGMLDGLHMTSLKGALMSRGAREIARLIKVCGGNERSAYGLCHLGDYQATVFSEYSHNRAFGEYYVGGKDFGKLAEGYYTVPALIKMADDNSVELPICSAVYDVLYRGVEPKTALMRLFDRSQKIEF